MSPQWNEATKLSSPRQRSSELLFLYSSSLTFRGSRLWSAVSEPTDPSSSMSSMSSSVSLVMYEPLCLDRHHSSTAMMQITSNRAAPTIPRRWSINVKTGDDRKISKSNLTTMFQRIQDQTQICAVKLQFCL